jgi:hypothetical protein
MAAFAASSQFRTMTSALVDQPIHHSTNYCS